MGDPGKLNSLPRPHPRPKPPMRPRPNDPQPVPDDHSDDENFSWEHFEDEDSNDKRAADKNHGAKADDGPSDNEYPAEQDPFAECYIANSDASDSDSDSDDETHWFAHTNDENLIADYGDDEYELFDDFYEDGAGRGCRRKVTLIPGCRAKRRTPGTQCSSAATKGATKKGATTKVAATVNSLKSLKISKAKREVAGFKRFVADEPHPQQEVDNVFERNSSGPGEKQAKTGLRRPFLIPGNWTARKNGPAAGGFVRMGEFVKPR